MAVPRSRAAAGLLTLWLAAAAATTGCREIVQYDDRPVPGPSATITWERTAGLENEAILALRADPAGVIYAGSESGRLYRTVTDGDDWTPLTIPWQGGAVTAIVVDPLRRISVANDVHGVIQSADGGVTWQSINAGLADTQVYALALLPGGNLAAGSARGAVSVSGAGDSLWTEKFNAARPITFILAISSDEIYAAAWNAGIFRFGLGSDQVVSVNAGLSDLYVNALHTGGSFLFAGTRSSGVFRSNAESIFWQSTGGGTINREVIVFRTTQYGELFAGTGSGVYVSPDQGLRWTRLDAGIGSQEVRALAVNENARVFAGTANGVYRSIRPD